VLLIKNLTSGNIRQLTELSDNVESSVSWSLSNKILFSDSQDEVYTIWPDGSHRSVISDGESRDASWSPTGDNIAFLEDPNDDHISISEKDGTVRWIFIEKGAYKIIGTPIWSPDGRSLLVTMSYSVSDQQVTDTFLLDLTTENVIPKKIANDDYTQVDWQARQ
jgi:Tol biopolymer transport system component